MAQFKVLENYRDKELGKSLKIGDVVDMTVKRANYVNKNNKKNKDYLERITKEKEGD